MMEATWIFGLLCLSVMTSSIADFGLNKPHLLFHLGERRPVSVNYGMGYWMSDAASPTRQYFSSSRLWYETTRNGLYVDMVSHNGDSHAHQTINDTTHHTMTEAKYQLQAEGWAERISITRKAPSKDRTANHIVYWFNYITVENNDPAMTNHKDYTTPIHLSLTQQDPHKMIVNITKVDRPSETVTIESTEPMKVFGFSMNISESYTIRSIADEFKHLVELSRFKKVRRTNQTDMHEWENTQVKLMKRDKWVGEKFVAMFFYGEFKDKNTITVSNHSQGFDSARFEQKSKQINESLFNAPSLQQHSAFLRHILYNLYGGISFYYGVLYTQNSLLRHELDYSYTFTPSRLIFPRGFLWDDGFHISVALHHNPSLALDVLRNWMRKIDLFGWIGREQIRGAEISSMMPEVKFVYQDIFEMNPPTLIIPITTLISKAKQGVLNHQNENKLKQLLRDNFWKLEKWYRYFVSTQSHNDLMEDEAINRSIKYRWRCKDDCERGNFMGSGLDDYPRTEQPQQLSKQHVDLMSWIYLFSEGLQQVAEYLNKPKPMKFYRNRKSQMRHKVLDECLDPQDMLFKDIAVAGKNKFVDQRVTRTGYISLFPFITGMLRHQHYDPSQRQMVKNALKKALHIISDEKGLLSQDGIRSLSLSDSMYGTGDNYWRGAVWMPINYLALKAIKQNYWEDEQARKVYSLIRERLITTVKGNWQKTGYLFENYHLGQGNRGYPFYGWTSLITNIITEQY